MPETAGGSHDRTGILQFFYERILPADSVLFDGGLYAAARQAGGRGADGGAGGHAWTEKLRTNLQWAKAVHDSTLYARLNEDQKKFLDGYIAYMDARFQSALLPGRLPWLVRNSHYINPHVHGIFAHLTHAAFGSVGVKFATRFLGKK